MSKFHGDSRLAPPHVPLSITVINPKKKSKHTCPAMMPMDCIDMDLPTFTKSYGPHVIQAVHDLLQHPSFKNGLEKPKLIVTP